MPLYRTTPGIAIGPKKVIPKRAMAKETGIKSNKKPENTERNPELAERKRPERSQTLCVCKSNGCTKVKKLPIIMPDKYKTGSKTRRTFRKRTQGLSMLSGINHHIHITPFTIYMCDDQKV